MKTHPWQEHFSILSVLNPGIVKQTSPISRPDIKQVLNTAMPTARIPSLIEDPFWYCPLSSLF